MTNRWLFGNHSRYCKPKQLSVSPMNVKEACQTNALTLIGLYKLVQESASGMGLVLDGPLVAVCEDAGVNRTQVYERKRQIENILETIELAGPGRPKNRIAQDPHTEEQQRWHLREKILRYRLAHPGTVVTHESGYATYSDACIRFLLDLLEEWQGSIEGFCQEAAVPYQTLRSWGRKDQLTPYIGHHNRPCPDMPATASEDFRQIVEDCATWEGSLREFFKYESARMHLSPSLIRRVLVICGILPVKSQKGPRYRGSTAQCEPGNVLVTDGKEVEVIFTGTGEVGSYNWQGIVDQATACHTAVVVTDTECAEGVRNAFDESCGFFGRSPQGLLHDNKPIHSDQNLRDHVEQTTLMIPATLNRPENKAVIEGEFGKFEQAVGTIYLNDESEEALRKSAVHEIIRAYTSGINHAGRVEFDGKSRQQVLQEACPYPDKDRKFIEQLHADHTKTQRFDMLPTHNVSLTLLNEGFKRFGIEDLDPQSKTRQWLAGAFTPEAIRQGLAIFGTEQGKGRIQNKFAHRYVVKVIQNCQHEIDLRQQEALLREFAQIERTAWLDEFETENNNLMQECDGTSPDNDAAFRISDNILFGSLCLARSFWEEKLETLLKKQTDRFVAVCAHIRHVFEATWQDRFALINRIINWEQQIAGKSAKCKSALYS